MAVRVLGEPRTCFFTIERIYGRQQPNKYWDELPHNKPIRDLEYVIRLDTLPNAADLVDAPLWKLLETYLTLKRHGKLPPRYEPPKPKKDSP